MIKYIFLSLALAWFCITAPTDHGIRFDKRDGALPTLTLPYGTWQATKFDPNGDIYTFKNIRFGAPPVGELRWAKPAPPAQETTIQDGSYGPICIQSAIKTEFIGSISVPSISATSEDCLFLDIYVPAKAITNPSLKLPVISWFYGGGYIFGGKDQFEPLLPFYDGTGLIQASDGNVIIVTSNYRVGPLGFLAGTTMENEGLPNAGLYDQRAALQWIQDYIGLVGGDKCQVSAWGESAGAGSILHHLTAFGGAQDPLFSRAVLESPAYEFLFDRKGSLEQTFQDFAAFAGCAGLGVSCLRAASTKNISDASVALSEAAPPVRTFGPSADGAFVRQLAPLEFASGHYWKGISSIILSHTSREGDSFVGNTIETDQGFNEFVDSIFPAYSKTAGVNSAIETQYPPVMSGTNRKYSSERDRLIDVTQDSSFQCNVRYLSDAYKGKNWNIRYSATTGLHGVDLVPTFYNLNIDVPILGTEISLPLVPGFGSFAQAYQSYLVSHARTGNPNKFRKTFNLPPAISWPQPGNTGDALTNVLDATDLGFNYITDDLTRKSRCGFWEDVAAAVTSLGGYAPPGSVVPTTLVPVTNDPSANFSGPI